MPDPLTACAAPLLSPGYVVARDNGSFTGSMLEAAKLCDTQTGLGLPEVKTYIDMVQILSNVSLLKDGLTIPIANNIRESV